MWPSWVQVLIHFWFPMHLLTFVASWGSKYFIRIDSILSINSARAELNVMWCCCPNNSHVKFNPLSTINLFCHRTVFHSLYPHNYWILLVGKSKVINSIRLNVRTEAGETQTQNCQFSEAAINHTQHNFVLHSWLTMQWQPLYTSSLVRNKVHRLVPNLTLEKCASGDAKFDGFPFSLAGLQHLISFLLLTVLQPLWIALWSIWEAPVEEKWVEKIRCMAKNSTHKANTPNRVCIYRLRLQS